ncbi:Gfo/Idh/MocA family protein [Actinomyces qiguomingii]|uniref:Gfo/Idh/MocA family protein n=1 Tax=Actinomyces qiguomingii TaxID=2057800 RepID=UPI0013049701|nr:Gfo/Idh/MocA family oxidoreductase [Actinomyces qiguomingii]
MKRVPTIAVVGIHGHGGRHVRHVLALQGRGWARLAATVDLRPPRAAVAPHFATLRRCLQSVDVDVVVIATPISTHLELAVTALSAGCDVLLEKPPTASLEEYRRLLTVAGSSGRILQIGFQALGSAAVPRLRRAFADGMVGSLRAVGIAGCWSRPVSYWRRAPWAGRRTLDGCDVVDGVLTNPFAHAFASALAILGCGRADDVGPIVLDQYRVNDIEADDTSAVRIQTRTGAAVTAALTLCARREAPPLITFYGDKGAVELAYTEDRARHLDAHGNTVAGIEYGRRDLLGNLLAARQGEEELLVPLESVSGFMTLLEAVRRAPDPRPIAPELVTWRDEPVADGTDRTPVLRDATRWVHHCASTGSTFREAGAPWAVSSRDD